MIEVVFRASMPDELLLQFIQVIRDFDMKHDPDHTDKIKFEMLTDSDWPADKMTAVLQAVQPQPKFLFVRKFEK